MAAHPELERQISVEDERARFADTEYMHGPLSVVVLGASGDLAKKKTYPSLFALFKLGFLPQHATICGYARSGKTDEEFRAHLQPWLKGDALQVEQFLQLCIYRSGPYDSHERMAAVAEELAAAEASCSAADGCTPANRVFYFALPPSQFVTAATPAKAVLCGNAGYKRVVVEKPFGRDLESSNELARDLSALFSEDQTYRIDHYLGKEMVQSLIGLRFGNAFFEPIWNYQHVACVVITFKEDIGTQGRGGYFDNYGIIRDVMQNHLLQVLALVAMEPPYQIFGAALRDEKVKVLRSIQPLTMADVVVGQYTSDGTEPAYVDDPTVPDDSVTPTFATARFTINNARWRGVPFIIKCGKGLNERKAEVRVQFKAPPTAFLFENHGAHSHPLPRNELVIRLQPSEAVYLKTNVKAPGLKTRVEASELDLTYAHRYPGEELPDAYTRLLLDVFRGKQTTFVRGDELEAAWRIFTPLLHQLERERVVPTPYEFGSRGPPESDALIEAAGFLRDEGYKWSGPRRCSR